ncbi:tetratricopeptide repeat protein [Bacillus dakarensis]|uniref:tetratricopeptide repeat protein n=1 Tax=Robertmurraya dakarensis TaxID=1926278 RepID=UPI0009813B17|nr:tetratricopeptide repeat protein [Bacillus dakarensis]
MNRDSNAIKSKMGTLLPFIPTGEYYFSKGLKSYQRRDFHKAKKYLERAMQLEPGEPMIACQLAIVFTELGQYKESNDILRMILEEWDEDMVECHYFLANNFAHMGMFKDAYHHATLYMELGDDGEFAEETEDLIELLMLEADDIEDDDLYEADDLISMQEEARELLENGHFLKAVDLLENVIQDFPEYWSAYNNLALAYFYLGETKKAKNILNEVLKKNPGNLHALCNKTVFAQYKNDHETVSVMKETLKKIKPLLIEHQFKLGTTFALIGEYDAAYAWLKKLHKQGYEGDGPFYYWLAYSAYHTGRNSTAEKAWKKVLQFNPEKEGLEPWNDEKSSVEHFEEHAESIKQKLQSENLEERLFGLFLTSLSDHKNELLEGYEAETPLEEQYLRIVSDPMAADASSVEIAHRTASQLYGFHHPIGTAEAGLYLLWFSIYVEIEKEQQHLTKNEKAYAAAAEYVWRKLRREKVSQSYFAEQYGLSLSTIQKYVKIVNSYLN